MAAARHNRSRRALLGARDAVPIVGACPTPSLSAASVGQARAASSAAHRRWTRALAAFDRAGARLAAFSAGEAALPPEQRSLAVEDELDARFNRLECARLDALCRLLRLPAPDLPAFAAKIALIVDETAWELADAPLCLAALKADARRLCHER